MTGRPIRIPGFDLFHFFHTTRPGDFLSHDSPGRFATATSYDIGLPGQDIEIIFEDLII